MTVVAALCGVACAYSLLARVFDDVGMSVLERAATAVWPILVAPLAYGLAGAATARRLRHPSQRQVIGWSATALVGSGLLLAAIPASRPVAPWLPVAELEVVALGQKAAESRSTEVWIQEMRPEHGRAIGPHEFRGDSTWERRADSIGSHRNQPTTARWIGRVAGRFNLMFAAHPWCGIAEVRWRGQSHTVDLYAAEATRRAVVLEAAAPFGILERAYSVFLLMCDLLAVGGLLLLGGTALATRMLPSAPEVSWPAGVLYALPCACVCTAYLLADWPGLLSPDSIDQWMQIVRGDYNDHHPAFHSLCMALIAAVWPSPAAVAVTQVVLFVAVIGWTMLQLQRLGLPRGWCWLTAIVFALLPPNGPMAITLWKDVWFTLAMIVFTVLVLKIVASRGEAARRWLFCLSLALAAALVVLYRHNGFLPALATLLLLPLLYRGYRVRFALVFGLALALVVAARGPLFSAFKVQPARTAGWVLPAMHLIAAHRSAATPLNDAETGLLRDVRPEEPWPYDPYFMNPTLFDGKFNFSAAQADRRRLGELAIALTARAPSVTQTHLVRQASVVWRITRPPGSGYFTVLGGRSGANVVTIWPPDNALNLKPHSLWPWMRPWLGEYVTATQEWRTSWLLWRTAPYLLLLVAGVLVAAARAGDLRYLIVAMPIVLNSAFIALAGSAQDFRYQYPAYVLGVLLGVFLLGYATCPRSASVSSGLATASH